MVNNRVIIMDENGHKHLKNVVYLFKSDLKAAVSNPIVITVLIALMIIPSLYALLNIAACWDPYGSTEHLSFAIASSDENATLGNQSINVGQEIVKNMKNNTKFDWKFVSEADAREGVKKGDYSAAVIFPSNFSSNIVSITTQNPQPAEMEYLINVKNNPMASRLGNAAAKEIQTQASSTIVKIMGVEAVEKLSILQSTLAAGSAKLGAGADKVNAGASQVNSGMSQVNAGASQVNAGASELSNKSGQVISGASAVDSQASALQQGASQVSQGASKIGASASQLEHSVNISKIPDKKLQYVVASSIELAKASGDLAKGSSKLANGSSKLAKGSSKLANGSVALATGSSALAAGSTQLASGSIRMAKGSTQLASGSSLLANSAAYGFATASTALESVTSINQNNLGDYLYSPVKLCKNEIFKVNNYGSEVAPFYLVLSIWVGALISCVMLKMRYMKTKYTPLEVYFGKLGLFVVLSIFQATVTIIGSFLLGIDINNPILFILTMYFISLLFTLLIYSIISVFGNVGKGIVVVLLVLQISSTGGIYPVELMAPFFQWISPLLPMTYAITMMREATLGVLWSNYIPNFLVLLGLGIATILISYLIKEKFDERANTFEEALERSKLF